MAEVFYPPPLSLLPGSAALAQFAGKEGFWRLSFVGGLQEYPYWYLGVPFAYLTGPVTPAILALLSRLTGGVLSAAVVLVVLSFILGAGGVVWLTRALWTKVSRKQAFTAGVIYFIQPWLWLAGWGWTEASRVVGLGILPLSLAAGIIWLETGRGKARALLLITLLILTNTYLYFVGICGWLIWAVAKGWLEAERKVNEAGDWETQFDWTWLKQATKLAVGAFLASVVWYGPGYWLNLVFGGASVGGRPLVLAAAWIGNLFKISLPFILTVWWLVKKGRKKPPAFYWLAGWLGLWGFLTLTRFLADPDFWLDWSQYWGEVSLGLALLIGFRLTYPKTLNRLWIGLFGLILAGGWLGAVWQRSVWLPGRRLDGLVAAKVAAWAVDRPGTWFVSGTPVFWLNALSAQTRQLRGGADQGSTHKDWREWAYLLRESSDPEEVKRVIQEAGISWVVVHTAESKEFYRDFKHPEIWQGVGELVIEDQGDRLYRF